MTTPYVTGFSNGFVSENVIAGTLTGYYNTSEDPHITAGAEYARMLQAYDANDCVISNNKRLLQHNCRPYYAGHRIRCLLWDFQKYILRQHLY